ncbi:hypothetical protein PPL19_10642 [Pseudomonas psychrotolerans L19]|nr:hypothetical protein PPL19_10642 [Pseudomonas psychrotolerans L19]
MLLVVLGLLKRFHTLILDHPRIAYRKIKDIVFEVWRLDGATQNIGRFSEPALQRFE